MALFQAQPPRPGQRPSLSARSYPTESDPAPQHERDGPDKKRRRVQRACDMCRLKKVRCEGGSPSRKPCNNCVNGKYDCTYVQTAKVEARDKAYVQSLEARLVKMEELLRKALPEAEGSRSSVNSTPDPSGSSFIGAHRPTIHSSTPPDDCDSDDEELTVRRNIQEKLQHISLDPGTSHFVGKSSSLMFIQDAMESLQLKDSPLDSPFGRKESSSAAESSKWASPGFLPQARFTFPDDDLLQSLMKSYFIEIAPYFPLLHRPTFENQIAEGLHRRDEGFGSTALLVCALGARFSNDPRVYTDGRFDPQAAGWQYFNQVMATMRVINLDPPRVYDLQTAFLASLFLHGFTSPQSSWPIIGIGIRQALAMGAHRRKVYIGMPPAQGELLKRAFWLLIKTDRELSAALGRPIGIQDEDFDLDPSTECDDEYWFPDDPETPFKQPAGTPSVVAYLNCSLKLGQISSYAVRTIYSTAKSKTHLGLGAQWEERTVMELDSALNQWVDSIPEHLRWDPNQKNTTFLNQSVLLYTNYYGLQIAIHRPFLSPRRHPQVSFPSLAICTNAARSCVRVMETQYRRAKVEGFQQAPSITGLFGAGMVLLLNIWGAKRSGHAASMSKDIGLVQISIEMLKALKPWWAYAGRMGDALTELMRVGDLPVQEDPEQQTKAEAEEFSAHLRSTVPSPRDAGPSPQVVQPPTIPAPPPMVHFSNESSMDNHTFLPVRSEDLGRQPFHFDFSPQFPPASSHAPYAGNAPVAWDRSVLAQNMPASMNMPPPQLSAAPPPPDGFLRTLAAMSGDGAEDVLQSAPNMAVPIDMAGGENILGMWSSMSASMPWDEWGNYFANLATPDGQLWPAQ